MFASKRLFNIAMHKRRTSFDQEIGSIEPIVMFCVISPDNKKQCKANFGKFVELINIHANQIKSLVIIDGSYLNRHYQAQYCDYQNEAFLFEWRNAHQRSLAQLKVPYVVRSWYELTNTPQFAEKYNILQREYEMNKDFINIVNTVASKFEHKGELQKCKDYLLEECAGALLVDGYLVYPGELNEAIKYVLKNYGGKLQFISYTLGRNHISKEQPSTQLQPRSDFFAHQPLSSILYESPLTTTIAGIITSFNLDSITLPQRAWFIQQVLAISTQLVQQQNIEKNKNHERKW